MKEERTLQIIPPSRKRSKLSLDSVFSSKSEQAVLKALATTLTYTRLAYDISDHMLDSYRGFHIYIAKNVDHTKWVLDASQIVEANNYRLFKDEVLEICFDTINCISHTTEERAALLALFRKNLLETNMKSA